MNNNISVKKNIFSLLISKLFGKVYTIPLIAWLTFFFVLPTLIIVVFSFLEKKAYGGVILKFSLDGYKALFNISFLRVVIFTLYISIISTFLTILLAIPVSYFIARSKYKNILLLFIIIPFWTNFLIRIFAWIAILGNNGFINNVLISLGIIKDPVRLLYNQYAIIIVTVYTYLSYAILPLYSSIEKFDFSLLEAARDLGATKMQSIFRVFIPSVKGGIITATIFTFIPALGSYAIPLLVGGEKSYMIGNLIARELKITFNWPLASSMSVILTLVTTIGILIFVNTNKSKVEAIREEKLNKN